MMDHAVCAPRIVCLSFETSSSFLLYFILCFYSSSIPIYHYKSVGVRRQHTVPAMKERNLYSENETTTKYYSYIATDAKQIFGGIRIL